MNFKKFINKIELIRNKDSLNVKRLCSMEIKKHTHLLIGYYEHDKEEIRFDQYEGVCVRLKLNGLNTKLIVNSKLQKTNLKLNFFLYNPYLFDLKKKY